MLMASYHPVITREVMCMAMVVQVVTIMAVEATDKVIRHHLSLKLSAIVKVIHKEYSRFLNQFFPTPCLYHILNMIIYTSYINI